ncbi:DUF2218 domain-containing protein [Comamonas sediminis]|uniref:DUF2218 domain-containing protein n=1 Tax=Comamonas sediminis TaxID=1783360 RepID=A0ABV4B753_9BURK
MTSSTDTPFSTQGQVATPEASRYLQRLCYHFSRKIKVQYDSLQGEAQFPWGHCSLRADECTLADDALALARVRHAIDAHVALFSRKNPMQVEWV